MLGVPFASGFALPFKGVTPSPVKLETITRRSVLMTLISAAVARTEPRFRVYARVLPDYLSRLAKAAQEKRDAELAAIHTAADVQARQAWARRTLWDLIGGEPQRTPLQVQNTGSFERKGYRLEKLSYESRPGVRIPANLYVPTESGKGPFPGVLFQLGHSLNGKAAEPYQKCCQGLARLGYVVLSFDPMGQGERTYYRVDDADEEHSRAGRQMLLVGDTMTRLQLWDAVRSLDVLASQPMVDAKRLASTGQSGGGTLTMLLGAVDDRLACAAVSSGNTENFAVANFNAPGSTDDAEQDLVYAGDVGFDRWDLLTPMAPRPLLVLVSERDSFGTYSPQYIESSQAEFAKLQRLYELMGAKDRLHWGTSALPHGLAHPMRIQVYQFFEKYLRGGSGAAVREPMVQPEPDEALVVGVTATRTPVPAPAVGPVTAQELRGLLRMGELSHGRLRVMLEEQGESGKIQTLEVESEAGVFLPAYGWAPPEGTRSRGVLVVVEPSGRTRHWREGELYPRLAMAGWTVYAVDVRGIGDLRGEAGRGNPGYTVRHTSEEDYAWASMMLGRPLLGQRVADLLAVVDALSAQFGDKTPITLAGLGSMATPVLCAAALEERVTTAYVAGGLVRWASLLETDAYREPFASFLPGVLRKTDLPQIARLMGSRRLVIVGAVDGQGKTVPAAQVKSWYGPATQVREKVEWNLSSFAAL